MIRRLLRRTIDKVERELNFTNLLAATLVGAVSLAAPAAAQVSVEPATVRASTITPERIGASLAAVVGLIGAVIGGLALARSSGRVSTVNARRGAIKGNGWPIALKTIQRSHS